LSGFEDIKEKLPPHSTGAERSVLGALMIDKDAYDRISGDLAVSDFYHLAHRVVYKAIESLHERALEVDVMTVADSLEAAKELETAGGLEALMGLVSDVPSASNITTYATVVRDRAVARSLVLVGQNIADMGFNPENRNAAALVDEAEAAIFRMSDDRVAAAGPAGMDELLRNVIKKIDDIEQSGGGMTGITTGFRDIDLATTGLQKTDLIIVAGRPSMGKSAFMMNLAEAALLSDAGPVPVFSLEMPQEQLMMRMVSGLGRVDQNNMRTGRMSKDEWSRVVRATEILSDKKLFIDDSGGLTTGQIRSRCRRIAKEHGTLAMIVVDYLQLMSGSAGGGENRTQEISEISRGLKAIAKEFRCPVVAGSQLNRGLESRTDKRPIMSDLRESGAIEQDADIIMALYRDEVYNDMSEDKGIAEVLILKQRNGPIGRKRLAFHGQYTRFEDIVQQETRYDDSYTEQGGF